MLISEYIKHILNECENINIEQIAFEVSLNERGLVQQDGSNKVSFTINIEQKDVKTNP